MKLLANENFPLASVKYLEANGFDIRAIGIDNPSVLDREVMEMAINENRIILTFDRDHGELIFKHNYQPPEGVIYLRLSEYESDEPGKIIEAILNDPTFDTYRKLTVVERDLTRQKQY
jgi:predicted nuclease of predicted toxin-antitoxin system